MKPLILGVGNILLSDEGVGVRVVQELEKRSEIQPHFDIIDGGTCGMELSCRRMRQISADTASRVW